MYTDSPLDFDINYYIGTRAKSQACLVDEFLNPIAKNANLTDFMSHPLQMTEKQHKKERLEP